MGKANPAFPSSKGYISMKVIITKVESTWEPGSYTFLVWPLVSSNQFVLYIGKSEESAVAWCK